MQLNVATNPQHSRTDEVVVEPLDGCQLRASLPGFQPYLANVSFQSLDRTDLGLIVLKSAATKDGYTISLANANAPHDARLAYDQARKQLSKGNSKAARKELTKAITIYPKYAAAWLELGRIQMDSGDPSAARQSFEKALAADANYLPPYERLAVLALDAGQWQDLADTTERLIHLNAYEYPEAYYYNALANLGLQHLDDAAKSARQALEQDSKRFSRAYYLLGMTLAKRGDFASAAAQLKLYLASQPPPSDSAKIQRQLTAFEQQARQ
ncbi:MAG TPA: tetratricopeptide repeat protein [Bryobacteraceae bacterium]